MHSLRVSPHERKILVTPEASLVKRTPDDVDIIAGLIVVSVL